MVMMSEKIGKYKIVKTILKEGNGKKPAFNLGAKATFHFKTIIANQDKVIS